MDLAFTNLDVFERVVTLLRKAGQLKYLYIGQSHKFWPDCILPPIKRSFRPTFLRQLTHLELRDINITVECLEGAHNLTYVRFHRDLHHLGQTKEVTKLIRALAGKPIRHFRADLELPSTEIIRLAAETMPDLVSLILGYGCRFDSRNYVCNLYLVGVYNPALPLERPRSQVHCEIGHSGGLALTVQKPSDILLATMGWATRCS